jgi:tRNA dimethylallyltransferase
LSTPLVVLGPTASGKSDLAMALATQRAGHAANTSRSVFEIVAVDAMQVYRGMDIGTAKPTAADRQSVTHHGLDLVEPDAEFTVAQFAAEASTAIADIQRRANVPLLVAGTGLYLRALTDPMEIPGNWPDVRAALDQRLTYESVEQLYGELAKLDPQAATRMEPTNARRVVRALEVCLGSGRRFSSFGPGIDSYPPVPFVQVGLRWPRQRLAERIEQRVHRMMVDGLLDEVERLRERHRRLSRTALQALGYKELYEHLDGHVSLNEAVERIIVRTRQFAVRQERWFRRDPRVQWVDIETDAVTEALPVIEELLPR